MNCVVSYGYLYYNEIYNKKDDCRYNTIKSSGWWIPCARYLTNIQYASNVCYDKLNNWILWLQEKWYLDHSSCFLSPWFLSTSSRALTLKVKVCLLYMYKCVCVCVRVHCTSPEDDVISIATYCNIFLLLWAIRPSTKFRMSSAFPRQWCRATAPHYNDHGSLF